MYDVLFICTLAYVFFISSFSIGKGAYLYLLSMWKFKKRQTFCITQAWQNDNEKKRKKEREQVGALSLWRNCRKRDEKYTFPFSKYKKLFFFIYCVSFLRYSFVSFPEDKSWISCLLSLHWTVCLTWKFIFRKDDWLVGSLQYGTCMNCMNVLFSYWVMWCGSNYRIEILPNGAADFSYI